MRFGFGEVTEENEASDTNQYENGHVDVSNKAFKQACSEYPAMPPAGAVGLMLADLAGVQVAVGNGNPDYDALTDDLQTIEGVGEETAEEVVSVVREALSDD